MIYIGIDNGVSGTIGIIADGKASQNKTPVKKCLNYTKAKQWVNRLDSPLFARIIEMLIEDHGLEKIHCYMERPMLNPMRWKSSVSAIRCFEATIILLEYFQIGYEVIDSKEWQKELLPSGLEKGELKKASKLVAKRLFPYIDFSKMPDGDGILISEYCRRRHTSGQ